jgi:hypothetical protein
MTGDPRYRKAVKTDDDSAGMCEKANTENKVKLSSVYSS